MNYVARQNGKEEPLTIGMLREIDARVGGDSDVNDSPGAGLSTREIFRENMKDFKFEHYRALFATKSLALHTMIIWAVWLTIGLSTSPSPSPSLIAVSFTFSTPQNISHHNLT